MSTKKTIKSAIESMMFIWGEPLKAKDVADIFNIENKEALQCCRELMEEYEQEGRGIVIREVNKAFQFTTRGENLPYIERLCTPVRRRRLSQSALETLAIVAYRQPVTKGEIESVRGIRCDRVMEGLMKKGLVEEVGRAETVGRPILYATTDTFLKQFGFETIRELPDIRDIEGLLDEEDVPEGLEGITPGQISLDELAAGEAEAGQTAGEAEAGQAAGEAEAGQAAGEAGNEAEDDAPEAAESDADQTETEEAAPEVDDADVPEEAAEEEDDVPMMDPEEALAAVEAAAKNASELAKNAKSIVAEAEEAAEVALPSEEDEGEGDEAHDVVDESPAEEVTADEES